MADTLDDWLEEWHREEGWRASKAEVQRLVDCLHELRRALDAKEADLHRMGVAREQLRQRLSLDNQRLRDEIDGMKAAFRA